MIRTDGRWWASAARGGAPPTSDDRWDLASLTKPVTATLALELDRCGALPLTTRIGRVWPEAAPGLRRRTLGSLLRHRAGLVPWLPLSSLFASPEDVAPGIVSKARWHGAIPGTYSDLGPILWLRSAERVTGRRAVSLLREWVLEPGSLSSGLVVDDSPTRSSQDGAFLPCGLDGSTESRLAAEMGIGVEVAAPPDPGVPQDANARFLGGYSGHAGLFGSLFGVADFASRWLSAQGIPDGRQRAEALRGRGRAGLGWFRRRLRNSAGSAVGAGAFGHVGFTGGSVWVDPEAGAAWVLLAHRDEVVPGLEAERRAFHAFSASADFPAATREPPLRATSDRS